MDTIGHILSFLPYLNVVFAIILIFLERRNISATLAWLVILFFLPGVGFLLYITFGQNLSREKIFVLKKEEDNEIKEYMVENQSHLKHTKTFSDKSMENFKDMLHLHFFHSQAPFTEDNDIEIFTDGNEKFNSLLKDIEDAKHNIHIGYYIIKNDDLGKKILSALVKKAQEGVEVKVLYDELGSRTLPRSFMQPLVDAGGKFAVFFPSTLRLINFRINYRNHRKIAVIDNCIGYVGGFNIGDEYLGKDKKFGYWRDTHLKIKGGAVNSLQIRFLLDWRHAANEENEFSPEYINHKTSSGNVGIQIVSSGPDSEWEQIKYGYIKMIQNAKEKIYIQTPYLILDQSINEAIKIASLSGVDVQIMIPNMPDHPFVYWASYANAGDLIKAGVKIYTYEKGFLHAKTIVVDNKVSSVGTANMDVRSFKLNFEVNAFIYDRNISSNLAKCFEKDIEDCNELTPSLYNNRSIKIKFKESISRLLSPIL